jgi:hypothetical protein
MDEGTSSKSDHPAEQQATGTPENEEPPVGGTARSTPSVAGATGALGAASSALKKRITSPQGLIRSSESARRSTGALGQVQRPSGALQASRPSGALQAASRAEPEAPPPPVATPTAAAPGSLELIKIADVIVLSVITLGIYGLVKFYHCGAGYLELASEKKSSFKGLFWGYLAVEVVLLIASLATVGLGYFVLVVPEVAVGAALLWEVLRLRDRAAGSTGQPIALTRPGTHMALWIVGAVLTGVVVGIAVLIVQAVKFFQDHNRIAEATGASAAAAATATPIAQVAGGKEGSDAGGNTIPCPSCGQQVYFAAKTCHHCKASMSAPALATPPSPPPIGPAPGEPPSPVSPQPAAPVSEKEDVEQSLKDLQRLKEQGLITPEEYEQKRREILSRL